MQASTSRQRPRFASGIFAAGALAAATLVILLSGCKHDSGSRANRPGISDRSDPSAPNPPPSPREFRAAWVATVGNIDWPSKPGLSTAEQQQEALAILDKCVELNFNAVVLQVRTSADALYDSRYEPWSYYLTGEQGKPPSPYYDPLKFWVDEAHRRGLELHAWFNPYRARVGAATYEAAASHVSRSNPGIVREFNGYQWLDPAEKGAQDLTYNVFMDVARRYDVDGLHIDDYFYPYAEYLKGADFPDDKTFKPYRESGGEMGREDWRRENVNQLIHRIYVGLKKEKPYVLFGISPFGIAHPRTPAEVESKFDQYSQLYADTLKWLQNGWLDYWTPQLYWKTDSPQPYAALLRWWHQQNTKKRNLWPGLIVSNLSGTRGRFRPTTTQASLPPDQLEAERQKFEEEQRRRDWSTDEVVKQIQITRDVVGAHSGNVFFSMKAFLRNYKGINEALKTGPYQEQALVPPSRWLDHTPPPAPVVKLARNGETTIATWSPGSGGWFGNGKEKAMWWAVWTQHGQQWRFHVYPATQTSARLDPDATVGAATAISVSAVDRVGNESERTVKLVNER
jgi:uncharacterized lipoprotein YddW (UPF0748 family)